MNEVHLDRLLKEIKDKREFMKLSKAFVARELNIERGYYSQIEGGCAPKVSEQSLIKIANFYNLNEDRVLWAHGKISSKNIEKLLNRPELIARVSSLGDTDVNVFKLYESDYEIKRKFGRIIGNARKKLNLPIKRFAKDIGVKVAYLENLEDGYIELPDDELIYKVCVKTNLNYNKIMYSIGRIPKDMQKLILSTEIKGELIND